MPDMDKRDHHITIYSVVVPKREQLLARGSLRYLCGGPRIVASLDISITTNSAGMHQLVRNGELSRSI